MPNYGLVVTPTYNPMSYEQYIQPFKDYAQVYNATVDQIDALEMEAGQWEKLADSDIDAPQYQQWKRYADDLRSYANEIATQGLSSKTRAGLSNMRQRYFKEIKPIEEAFNYRQKMAEEQRKLNPTGDIQWDIDFATTGLGTIMANPSIGYSGRSLSEMEEEGYKQAQSASSRRIITQKAADMGGQYYQILQGYGQQAAEEFLQQAKLSNPSEYQELVDLYNQVRGSYGTTSENSPYSAEQNTLADERILNGMMRGLALQDSYQSNRGYDYWWNSHYGNNEEGKPKALIFKTSLHDDSGNEQVFNVIVNSDGEYEYYNDVSKEKITDPNVLKELAKTKPVPVAGLRPHSENGDIVDLVDLRTGQPMTQGSDHKIISFNRTTHDINPLTGEIIPKTQDVPLLTGEHFAVVRNSTGDKKTGNTRGAIHKQDEGAFDSDKSPVLTYDQLSEDEKKVLPKSVKRAPTKYLFKRKRRIADGWFNGYNEGIMFKNVSTTDEDFETKKLQDVQISNLFVKLNEDSKLNTDSIG